MSPWIITWISVGLGLVVQQETGDPGAGAAYADKVCARCHTIKGARPSPEPTAPPFEVVANTPGMTATALAVWLTTSHPTMPNIVLEQQDLDNVIAVILTLKDKPALKLPDPPKVNGSSYEDKAARSLAPLAQAIECRQPHLQYSKDQIIVARRPLDSSRSRAPSRSD